MLRTLLRVAMPTTGAFVGAACVTAVSQASLDDTSPFAVVEQLGRVLVLIEEEYVEAVARSRLLDGAIKGMVAELDPHSSYLPARDFRILRDDARGQFAGIGVEVDFSDDRVTVVAPIDQSPAQRAGMRSGDVIISIDGERAVGKSAADLIKKMRGAPGSTVHVSVRRGSEPELVHLTIVREVIAVSSVLSALLDGNIAYLRIKQFQSDTHEELLQKIAGLQQGTHPIEGVVLDMRNNPGGLVHAATLVADEFLDAGTIYTTRHRGEVVSEVRAHRGGAFAQCPIVVLVNEFSASASELVAGALQDHGRGTIVGARTFGKGSVQSIIDLPHGAGLRLTTMRYYTPKGRTIQVEGIGPDVAVETQLTNLGPGGVPREGTLDNHLSSDSTQKRTAQEQQPPSADAVGDQKKVGGKEPDETQTHLGVARTVPANPSGGSDEALSVAYGVLLQKLRSGKPSTQREL